MDRKVVCLNVLTRGSVIFARIIMLARKGMTATSKFCRNFAEILKVIYLYLLISILRLPRPLTRVSTSKTKICMLFRMLSFLLSIQIWCKSNVSLSNVLLAICSRNWNDWAIWRANNSCLLTEKNYRKWKIVHAQFTKKGNVQLWTKDCRWLFVKMVQCQNQINHLELNGDVKLKYEIEHPIDWQRQRCCICTLPLEINSTQVDADKETMSHTDFIIFKEHKFLKNISSDQERATSDSIKILKNFHAAFCKFPKISILLPTVLNTAVGELFWKRWQLFWRWTPIHFLPQKMLRLWEFWGVVRGYCLRWSKVQRQN